MFALSPTVQRPRAVERQEPRQLVQLLGNAGRRRRGHLVEPLPNPSGQTLQRFATVFPAVRREAVRLESVVRRVLHLPQEFVRFRSFEDTYGSKVP